MRANRFVIRCAIVAALTTGGASLAAAQQASPIISYSATAVHGIPGAPETSGKVIKSGENMRLEFEQNGRKVIQILLPEQGVMYVLDPQSKSYLELRGQSVPATAGAGANAPCNEQSQLAVCKQTGSDMVSGISVERWQLSAQPQTPPLTILWDPTRRQALRQDFPDGSNLAMSFKAMENLNDRSTEHWQIRLHSPGQEAQYGDWWFDPALRVVVREDLPGGETRRLDDITIGPVDPSAFVVPEGWQKRDASAIATPQAPTTPASE